MIDATIPAIERTLHLAASPDRVWRAITDPAELARWFPDRASLELRVGGAGRFEWDEHGWVAIRVEAVEAPRYLAWSWANQPDRAIEATDATLVEWWVDPDERGGTVLRVRESGFVRPEHRAGNESGWTSELAELTRLLGEDG